MIKGITYWLKSLAAVFTKEIFLSFHDVAVIIFFVVLALFYPILYSLIYNTETLHDVPVVVVDDSRTALSREFTRDLDATPEVRIAYYATTIAEARVLLNKKDAYAIVHFPSEFSKEVNSGRQGHVVAYCDMSVLMRYKQVLSAMSNVQQHMCAQLQTQKVRATGLSVDIEVAATAANANTSIIESKQVPIGNTGMGIASAILPATLVLVLQQGMLLGICTLRGGSRERRLRHQGFDPYEVKAPVVATLWGKTFAYLLIYLLPTIYALLIVPQFFSFPQNGNPVQIIMFILPMLIAASFMGQSLQVLVNERESTFLVLVFTSVIFIFLSGISWPRHAMGPLWVSIGNMLPSTWACNGYILMQTDGATLGEVAHHYKMLWVLAGIYFVVAMLIEKFVCRPRYRRMQYYASKDPDILLREELRRNGSDRVDNDLDPHRLDISLRRLRAREKEANW